MLNRSAARQPQSAPTAASALASQLRGGKHSSGSGSSSRSLAGRRGGAARPLARLDRAADALDAADPAARPGEAVQYVAREGPELYRQFERQATERGWRIPLTMLNASETRLRMV